MKNLLAFTSVIALLTFNANSVKAEEVATKTTFTKAEIEQIIGDYIEKNPAVIVDAFANHQRMEQERADKQAEEALVKNLDFLSNNEKSPFIGNPDAKVTIVEFFDYNCGYCKRALPDIEKIVDQYDDVKVVFKELPILSPQSEVAARYALAANEQGKYFEFHRELMSAKGRLDESRILDIATGLDLDVDQLKKDKDNPEISSYINQVRDKSSEIGIRGTPAFVVGDQLVRGAVGFDMLKNYIEQQKQ